MLLLKASRLRGYVRCRRRPTDVRRLFYTREEFVNSAVAKSAEFKNASTLYELHFTSFLT